MNCLSNNMEASQMHYVKRRKPSSKGCKLYISFKCAELIYGYRKQKNKWFSGVGGEGRDRLPGEWENMWGSGTALHLDCGGS